MMRNRALAALQKTYDDSYLGCSTAVYHESQGNEAEARRYWRSALEQINDFYGKNPPSTYISPNDTERALQDALKELELQCKERIDLLEALRISRCDDPKNPSTEKIPRRPSPDKSRDYGRASIGQGTVPAVTYSELSRPALPPRPLPHRVSSESHSLDGRGLLSDSGQARDMAPKSPSPSARSFQDKSLRSQSPERHTMRTTLRPGKQVKPLRKSEKPASEGSSKAASLAWSALGSRERLKRGTIEPSSSSSPKANAQTLREDNRPQVQTPLQWDSHSRRLVAPRESSSDTPRTPRRSGEHYHRGNSQLSVSAASSALNAISLQGQHRDGPRTSFSDMSLDERRASASNPHEDSIQDTYVESGSDVGPLGRSGHANFSRPAIRRKPATKPERAQPKPSREAASRQRRPKQVERHSSSSSLSSDEVGSSQEDSRAKSVDSRIRTDSQSHFAEEPTVEETPSKSSAWKRRKAEILRKLPSGVDEAAAKQILNDIVVRGDEVRWGDIAGLEIAKNALRETVVYPFLRPDLFMGLREPARGMLLFGPPGTGKTMLARAVATESKSTFFSISASSLTSKYLGESEKLVRALFGLARVLAPSIIFVDEIDSLLSQRSGSGEHEATRRIKTEFLIQWSDLQRAAAGRETTDRDRERGDANRVLVLAATNLPWAIDEAARRRFVRRQYIPLPETKTRETQLQTLLNQQKHELSADDIAKLVELTDGFSGSDITALAKDAAMGPLRSLGEALLDMTMEDIRPIQLSDFEASLGTIRPSVGKAGLKEHEDWAREFGERGG